jgi:hypothetical protein
MRWIYIFGTALVFSLVLLFAVTGLLVAVVGADPGPQWLLLAFVLLFVCGWFLGTRLFK